MAAPVHVIGFGNPWHGDDGFGVHVIARLRRERALPDGVALFDGGVAGLGALALFEGCRKAVVVDALRSGAAPGSVHRLAPGELAEAGAAASLHELGVAHLLAALALAPGAAPEVVLVCAEIGAIRPFSDELTPAVAAAVEPAIELVLRECTS
jgi:hydrogenase maturation protease